ncbi:MAG: hypothetical protein QXH96_01310 [Candidatus Geothermarchaeota archaeon]
MAMVLSAQHGVPQTSRLILENADHNLAEFLNINDGIGSGMAMSPHLAAYLHGSLVNFLGNGSTPEMVSENL